MADWTDERIALLTKLHAEGRSASQIASELGGGVTRNAVIGKAHRLKLPAPSLEGATSAGLPSSPKRTPERPRRAAGPTELAMPIYNPSKVSPIVPAPSASQPEPTGAGPAHAALQACDCRWPLGDPASDTFRFCAKPCVRAQDMPRARNGQLRVPTYCVAHYELSIQPNSERRTTRIMARAA